MTRWCRTSCAHGRARSGCPAADRRSSDVPLTRWSTPSPNWLATSRRARRNPMHLPPSTTRDSPWCRSRPQTDRRGLPARRNSKAPTASRRRAAMDRSIRRFHSHTRRRTRPRPRRSTSSLRVSLPQLLHANAHTGIRSAAAGDRERGKAHACRDAGLCTSCSAVSAVE